MRPELLDLLRCPFCGGRLELVTSLFHRCEDDEIADAILGCHCCVFPIVAGIPVMHLAPVAVAAREEVEAGRPDRAFARLLALADDAAAARFAELAASDSATYREVVEALGPGFEGGYFLYRFSDPTYLVADAVVRVVAPAVLSGGGRAIDVCGGSGHLTRSLCAAGAPAPVLADLYFAKLWLARRFTAPGCQPVCCDGNAPLPFARAAFDVVVCSDAFHYIWTKRLMASELMRLATGAGAVAVTHAHNANQWNPSAGMPLPPDAYRALFEELEPRLFAESRLLRDLIDRDAIDLSREHPQEALDADLALTIVASRNRAVFRTHDMPSRPHDTPRGEFRVNPLYAIAVDGGEVRLTLTFPSDDYADEYRDSRLYLADAVTIDRATLEALPAGRLPAGAEDLARRRIVLDLPKRYY